MKRKTLTALLVFIFIIPIIFGKKASWEEKIDEKVHQKLRIPIIILGKTQFLNPPSGFNEFCKSNTGRRRSDLRREVIEKLKEIAKTEQPKILKDLGSPKDAIQLWIVNAILAKLSPDEIKKAANHKAVKYIYLGDIPKYMARKKILKTISTVFSPEKRDPFSLEGKKIPWNLEMIGASNVWKELKVTGEGAVVAMLDAGANYEHEDLRKNIWINSNEIPNNEKDDDSNGYVDDYYGYNFWADTPEVKPIPGGRLQHGSVTSCLVAGDGTGGTITGVAPGAKIMLLVGPSYLTALAYQYAIENGADVLNMSFSWPKLGNARGLWRMMSDHAVCAGLVLVSGAGNFQKSAAVPEQIRIPEGIPSVICAGGIDKNMKVPPYCSLGPVEWSSVKFYNDYPFDKGGLIKPDVCGFPGPGYPVIQFRDNKGYIDPNKNIQGNSFSSPHITGVAALIFSANPELPAWKVKEILEATATDTGEPGKDPHSGAGLANAYKAVKTAMKELK